VGDPIKAKYVPDVATLASCFDLGKKIAEKLK